MYQKVGIIGLGLIGGSLAKALKNRLDIHNIVAFNRHDDVLKEAYQEGVISEYTTEVNHIFAGCDIVFICTPVDKIFEYTIKLLPFISKDCIVTDVGSTKGSLYEKMETLGDRVTFIGGHPMTGAERFRYQASREHLFENAYYIMTPGNGVTEAQAEEFKNMILAIGAIPINVSCSEHDRIVAAISHVPHIMASALVNTVKKLDDEKQYMHLLAAGGFKDVTRIASSSPDMWESICFENKEEILKVLTAMEETVSEIKARIEADDSEAVYSYFDSARLYRDSFATLSPKSIVKRYEITVDVLDRPGSIAIIAVLFSSNNINIKNMGIVNNRERDNGVLFFSFESEEDRKKSIKLLRGLNYEVQVKE